MPHSIPQASSLPAEDTDLGRWSFWREGGLRLLNGYNITIWLKLAQKSLQKSLETFQRGAGGMPQGHTSYM